MMRNFPIDQIDLDQNAPMSIRFRYGIDPISATCAVLLLRRSRRRGGAGELVSPLADRGFGTLSLVLAGTSKRAGRHSNGAAGRSLRSVSSVLLFRK